MVLHVVLPGESIYSIADRYKVSAVRLIQDNGLRLPYTLVVGQVIVVAFPDKTYKVQRGDTLVEIASKNGISLMQLLRNNPFLSDRKNAYPGEILVISYNNNKGIITTNGYAHVFIDREILRKTLPYLTYLSVFGYRTVAEAEIVSVEDTEIIRIAKEYGVAPIMLLSSLTLQGIGDVETSYRILYYEKYTDLHIGNILKILKEKGFYGLNITLQYINKKNMVLYENYIKKLTTRLTNEGFKIFVTLNPFTFIQNEITFEKLNYSNIGKDIDGITFLNYNWGFNYGPPLPATSIFYQKEFLDYAVNFILPEKIDIGMPIIGYDWELPYIVGVTKATALSVESAINLARDVGAVIMFDDTSETPYFEYFEDRAGVPIEHIVWFVDARTINATLKLIMDYRLNGGGIWNIVVFITQLWIVINSQYEIVKLLPVNPPS